MKSLSQVLKEYGLTRYLPRFQAMGITAENLCDVQYQEYDSLGVKMSTDRTTLSQLIEKIKANPEAVLAGEPDDAEVEEPRKTEEPKPRTIPIARPASRGEGHSKRTPSPAAARNEPVRPHVVPVEQISDMRIRVIVRKRPLNKKEIGRGEKDIVQIVSDRTIAVNVPRLKVDLTKYVESCRFTFDEVLDEYADNATVYARTAKGLVDFIFKKGKSTCFAYGQTGSGKTYTMMGNGDGIYNQAGRDIFAQRDRDYPHYAICVSFFEIYTGKLYDLLNNRTSLTALEDAKGQVNIVGLTEKELRDESELFNVLEEGNRVRKTAATGAHDDSSRSHAVLQIVLKDTKAKDKDKPVGKFAFVDLAGSEYGAVTSHSDRQTRIEGAEINKSLLALKECIRALHHDQGHTPFRQSKLTVVLRDSFVGNCATVMITNVSPSTSCAETSLNTLRYADRVKEIGEKGDRPCATPLAVPAPAATPAVSSPAPAEKREKEEAVVVEPEPRAKKTGLPPAAPKTKTKVRQAPPSQLADVDEVDPLTKTHLDLVADLMQEQETFISRHRVEIDDMVRLIKEEMGLLTEVEKPGANVDVYVAGLARVLDEKTKTISKLQKRLAMFKDGLDKEEKLSRSLGSKDTPPEGDEYQIHHDSEEDDMQIEDMDPSIDE